MKRKLKIVGTLVSLGLSLAMLAVGVYAATSVSFNISGSVSFVVTDVFVDVEGKVFLDPVASKGTSQVGETFTSKSYTGTTVMTPTDLDNKTWNIGVTNFTSTNDCIVYTLKITNSAKTGSVKASISALPVEIDGTSLESLFVIDDGNDTPLESNSPIIINAQSYALITITRTLTNKLKGIEETLAWATTVTIENYIKEPGTLFQPTINFSKNTMVETASISETQALSVQPTSVNYTRTDSIDWYSGDDGTQLVANGVRLTEENKYYGLKLSVSCEGYGNSFYVRFEQAGPYTITGDGYKITWDYQCVSQNGKYYIYSENGETVNITCLIELTDFSDNVEVLPEHLIFNIVISYGIN